MRARHLRRRLLEAAGSMLRKLGRIFIFLLGVACVGGGRFGLTTPDALAELLRSRVSPAVVCAMNDVFPCGTVIGYGLFLIGTLLMALALRAPAAAPSDARPAVAPATGTRGGSMLLLIACGLSAASATFATHRGAWPLVLLIGAGIGGLIAMHRLDRVRGTSFGNPLRARWEWIVVPLLVVGDLVLVGHDLTHWRWSGTPDEADFFGVAKSIVIGISERALLTEHGVFEFHPVLSSLYQSAFMWIFGVNAFAWKLSSAFALAVSLPFLYVFGRELWGARVGLMATVLFGTAQLATGFAHYGYNNVQVYPFITATLATFVWAQRRGSLLGFYLVGGIAGWAFYTYYTARLMPPLLLLLAWNLAGFTWSKDSRRMLAALALGLLLATLPVLAQLPNAVRNVGRVTEVPALTTTLPLAQTASRVALNWFLSAAYGAWYRGPSHLQWNPIVDPPAATLAAIGLWLGLRRARRRDPLRFLMLAYLSSALIIGATSPHYRPPLTRLLFLSPFTALLAAVAAESLVGAATRRASVGHVAAGGLVLLSAGWNIGAQHVTVTQRYHGAGNGTTSELLRLAQQLPATMRVVYVQRGDTDMVAVDSVLDEYGMQPRFTYLRPFSERVLEALSTLQPPFAVFYYLGDRAEIAVVRELLSQRFPSIPWVDSDPGTPWNLPHFVVPAGTPQAASRLHR